jgi:peptidoglycan-associated lipoprotein
MRTASTRAVWVPLGLALALVVGACAKRPAVQVASAPAPTGAPSPAMAAPAPAPVAPAPAPVAPAPAPTQATPPAPPPVAAAPAPAPPAPPPAPAPRPAPKEFQANAALKAIHFNFDKSDIRAEDAKILDASLAWLKANPTNLLLIEGHCDERGTSDYNLALGDRRAKAAMAYLVARGVRADRISVVSYGEERPVCTDHNEKCWAENRRAQFLVKEQ